MNNTLTKITYTINACYIVFLQKPEKNTNGKPLVHSYYQLCKNGQEVDSIHAALKQAYYFKLPNGSVINLCQMDKQEELPIYDGSPPPALQKMPQEHIDNIQHFFNFTMTIIRQVPHIDYPDAIYKPEGSKTIYLFDNEEDAYTKWQEFIEIAKKIPDNLTIKMLSDNNPRNCNSVLATMADVLGIAREKITFDEISQYGMQTYLL
jgi:hypothetical protein